MTTWAVGLVVALLAQAIWRLTPLALAPIQDGSLELHHQILYAFWVVVSIYTEGYRGFHKRFSPRVVSRAFHLGERPRPLYVLLALPYAMSLFHSTRRQLIVSWVFTLTLIAVIITVRFLPQPWRGIIDGGVVIGLGLGTLSILYFYVRGLSGRPPATTDLPSKDSLLPPAS